MRCRPETDTRGGTIREDPELRVRLVTERIPDNRVRPAGVQHGYTTARNAHKRVDLTIAMTSHPIYAHDTYLPTFVQIALAVDHTMHGSSPSFLAPSIRLSRHV